MFKFHIIQAEQGDSLLLNWDDAGKESFFLVDGGPDGVYATHLKAFLEQTVAGGVLERVILSHVDDDHINGLLSLFSDIQKGVVALKVGGLWHNSFNQILGKEIEERFFHLVDQNFIPREANFLLEKDRSIAQGDQLSHLSEGLNIPVNPDSGNEPRFSVEDIAGEIKINGLKIKVVGPTKKNLARLQKDWEKWLEKREKEIAKGIKVRALDQSVPNLSSIMLLVETAGKTILLTGDGRGDHLMQGLRAVGLLKKGKSFHVDVLKMPHHGSARNTTQKFLETVTADTYIFSANGKDGNPDFQTLEWLAQAVKASGRQVDILVTNEPKSVRDFKVAYPPKDWGYRLHILPENSHAFTLNLLPKAGENAVTYIEGGLPPKKPEETPHVIITQPGMGGTPSSRRALLVGINEFATVSGLRGCINDTQDVSDLLRNFYHFEDSEIKFLTNKQATGQGIRDGLDWLLRDFAGGDVRVFSFSSHGSQVDDQNDDEWECKDEVIIPYDHSWTNPFRDDDLRQIFERIPAGVNFTFLADCCHSGTIQKDVLEIEDFLPRYISPPPTIIGRISAKEEARDRGSDAYIQEKIQEELKNYPMDKWIEMIPVLMKKLMERYRENRFGSVAVEKHILLAGCEDKQTSADARIDGVYRGAFTWAIGKAIREANGNLTYAELMQNASAKMTRFSQTPQLECPPNLRNLRLFSALK